MKILYISAIIITLVGCASAGEVLKMGPDTYTVTGTAGSERGGEAGAKSAALKKANEYCSSKNRTILVISSSQQTLNGYGTGSAELIFKCIEE
jgi:hypothetical protein